MKELALTINRQIDSTIFATLSAPISASFNSFTLISWLATAYLIANAALQPLTGKLTDIFGRKNGLIFSNTFFAAGNLICGLAQSKWVIIFGRVVAGMGGGGLMAISTFICSDLVPLRKRGLIQGLGNVCYGLGAGVGGIYGGWISDVYNWRLAFLIQVPLVVASGILVAVVVKIPVKETKESRISRVDFLGAFLLVATLVLLLLGLNSGGTIVPWVHPLVLVPLSLSVVAFLAFIYVEDRVASEPIIPVKLLLNRTVACACLVNWFTSMSAYALLIYGPIYFQVRGYSATAAGARLIPNSLGAAVGSLGSGLVMRATGKYYYLSFVVNATLVAGLALIAATWDRNTPEIGPFVHIFLCGAGYGGMLTTTLLAIISAVDHKHQAVVTSASYAFRSTGSTIGITIASAVFQNMLKSQLWSRLGDKHHAAEIISRLRDNIGEIRNVPPSWHDAVIDSYIWAFRSVWLLLLGIAAIGTLIGLGMREHVLHSNLARK